MEEPLVIVELPALPDMNDEQIEDLKHLIRYAKRMNKGGFKKCIPVGINSLLFQSKNAENVYVRIDPVIWTAFLKHNIRLKISNE
jgi:hypothetical protein